MFAISRAPAAAELPHARAGLGPVATARTRLPRSAASLLLVALPILILAVIAWQRRWVAEDGFINFRVVNNIFAGTARCLIRSYVIKEVFIAALT